MYFGKIFQEFSWVMTQNPSNGLWKYFPENLLIHHPDFSMRSILNSNIWKRLFTRFTVISCLGAPARHLLMLHDLFQLSSMVTSQESKNFFLEKFSRKPPDSWPDNLSIWVNFSEGILMCGRFSGSTSCVTEFNLMSFFLLKVLEWTNRFW